MSTLTRRTNYTEDGIRIAVQFSERPGQNLLKILDPALPLSEFLGKVAEEYELPTHDNYMFCIESSSPSDQVVYITDQNRELIKKGTILSLVRSPAYTVNEVMKALHKEKSTVEWNYALKDLHTRHFQNLEFVTRFVEARGHQKLLQLLASGQCSGIVAALCYQAGLHYNILMAVRVLFLKYGLPAEKPEYGLVSWELINDDVLTKLIDGMRFGEVTLSTLDCCYELLENCIRRLPEKADFIIAKIDADQLFARLNNEVVGGRSPDKGLQANLLKFLNTIFCRAKERGNEMATVSSLMTLMNRDILTKCIPALRGEEPKLPPEILVEFQQHLLCPASLRRHTAMDPSDANRMAALDLMRSMVQKEEVSNRLFSGKFGPQEIEHFRYLGFENPENPHIDFEVSNGGMLAFDCVTYFMANHSQEAEEFFAPRVTSDSEPFPFIRGSTLLTNLLAKLFRLIGDLDSRNDPVNDTDFFPFLFGSDKPFEKVFCKCITAFSRTWRDMRATVNDMEAVRKVMREQLMQTFANADCRKRLQALDDGLQKNNYNEILRLQKQREEDKRRNKALSDDIRRGLGPRINQLILDNRINRMQAGSTFQLYDSTYLNMRSKQGSNLSLRLSPNKKDILYEVKNPNATETPNRKDNDRWQTDGDENREKISLTSVESVFFGQRCPHNPKVLKTYRKNSGNSESSDPSHSSDACKHSESSDSHEYAEAVESAKRCMTIIISTKDDKDEASKEERPAKQINLIAPNADCLNIWMDGLNALKGQQERSSLHERDFERLIDLEIKVRSLHLPPTHDARRRPEIPPRPRVLPKALQG